MTISPAAIALNRFGLGATPGDAVPADPKAWLIAQYAAFDPLPQGYAALPDAGAMVKAYQMEQRALRQAGRPAPPPPAPPMEASAMAPPAMARPAAVPLLPSNGRTPEQKELRRDYVQDVQGLYRQAVQARMQSALDTKAPFVERLVHFWSNHFCVSADNPQVTAFAGAFERDAIRPHVLGRFEDMMLAVERHPAMLVYLNQVQSIGPNSANAQRALARNPARAPGLNENLAREIMELHTLGVRSGYSQADVTEFARAMTGWSVQGIGAGSRADEGQADAFVFRPNLHEPGPRTILGTTYAQEGERQARAAMLDFARAPATARHIATKLARHFAGDAPPDALVDRLAASFAAGRGDLTAVYRTLIDSPEAWAPQPVKFKSPWEWTVSALRGLGRTDLGRMQVAGVQSQLGQPVWKPGSPAGWDDSAAAWAAPDALLRRVELAPRLAAPVGDTLDARTLGPRLIPASLTAATAAQVARAESPQSALALLLVSPDFLRR